MQAPAVTAGRSVWKLRLQVAFFPLLLIAMAHAIPVILDPDLMVGGNLTGPDAYMRLVRVLEWVQGGDWYDQLSRRSNAPFGEVLHWSRPLDLLLAGGAFIGSLFTDFSSALFWWGGLLNPLAHVLTLFVLLWAAELLFPAHGRTYLGILSMVQFSFIFMFAIGRPDHHGLITACLVAATGLVMRLMENDPPRKLGPVLGLILGLALWISIEGMFVAALVYAGLGLFWLLKAPRLDRALMDISLTAFLVLLLAMALEYPPADWAKPVYDALSVVHLTLFAALSLFWLLVHHLRLGRQRPAMRWIAAALGGGLTLVLVGFLFPKFFAGPMVDVDPRVVSLWYDNNGEVAPLILTDNLSATLQNLIGHFGAALPAFAFGVYLCISSRDSRRWQWLFLTGALFISIALAMNERRWVATMQLFLLFPYTALLLSLLDKYVGLKETWRALARAGTVILFGVTPLYAAALVLTVLPDRQDELQACDVPAIAGWLNENYPDEAQIVMTHNFIGPELLYRTPHAIIPSPYHRNRGGMLDYYDFFGKAEPAVPLGISRERQIDLVIICPKDVEATAFTNAGEEGNLFRHLLAGEPPDWLTKQTLPEDLADNLQVYKVEKSKLAN